jgi:predicted Zn-dependent protease
MNLATALQGMGHGPQAAAVLERGVAAYPYSATLTARLAQQYVVDGEANQARKLVEQYRAVFPEDSLMRAVEGHLDEAGKFAR